MFLRKVGISMKFTALLARTLYKLQALSYEAQIQNKFSVKNKLGNSLNKIHIHSENF
jgi:hypothetical protein